MWKKGHYQITDKLLIEAFVKENSFGTLISNGEPFPEASHVPMEWEAGNDGQPVLRGHLARTNTQWTRFAGSPGVLAIFQSPIHHYISSSWYEKPEAPTWDYMSVHIEGLIKVIDGPDLWESLSRLVDKYEVIARAPVTLATLPQTVLNQIKAIVGFEVSIDRINASFKMSQNRNETDYQAIIDELNILDTASSRLMSNALANLRQ